MKISKITSSFIGTIGVIVAALCLFLAPSPAVAGTKIGTPTNYLNLNTGLVGYWTFDGKNTNWSTGVTGNLVDSTNNGQLIGMSTTTSAVGGKIGQALQFDGSASLVQLPNNSTYNFDYTSTFTVSAWIMPGIINTVMPIFSTMDASGNGGYYFSTNSTDGLSLIIRDAVGASTVTSNDNIVPLGKWSLATVVFTGPTTATFYLNGVNQRSGTFTRNVAAISSPRYIGFQPNSSTYWKGTLDDVHVYNRAISATEAKQLYLSSAAKYDVTSAGGDTLTTGLVGWWTFDGPDMIKNVADKSGQNNAGDLVNFTSTTTVPGKIGQALKFNGSNNYIAIPDSASLNISTNITVSSWIYMKSWKESDVVENGASGYVFWTAPSNGNSIVWGKQSLSSGQVISNATFNNRLNQWIHIVGTYDGATLKFYVNGTLDNSSNSATSFTNGGSLTIGTGGDGNFDGYIDDFRIYNRTLSAAEIKQLYTSTAGGKTAVSLPGPTALSNGLVGYWTFDGKSTNWSTGVTKDSSGSGNNGSLIGMATTTSPVPGKIGQALSFPGIANDYIGLSSNPISSMSSANSICMWAYPKVFGHTTNSTNGSMLNLYTNSTNFTAISDNSSGQLLIDYQGGGIDYSKQGAGQLASNGWTDVCSVFDGSGIQTYINGVASSMSVSTASGSNFNGIGAIAADTGNWNGYLDDVRVYNRALSSNEVKQLYNLGR